MENKGPAWIVGACLGFFCGLGSGYALFHNANSQYVEVSEKRSSELLRSFQEADAERKRLSDELKDSRQNAAKQSQQLASMVSREAYEDMRTKLAASKERVNSLSGWIEQFKGQPLPVVVNRVSFGRKWSPWGDLGPSFQIEGGHPEDLADNTVKATSSEAGGPMLLRRNNDPMKAVEQFLYRQQNLAIVLLERGYDHACLLAGSTVAIAKANKEDQIKSGC